MFGLKKSDSKLKDKRKYNHILEINHIFEGGWHQYDILTTWGFGWTRILFSAQYVAFSDLIELMSVTFTPTINDGKEYIHFVRANNGIIQDCPELQNEGGALSVAGFSKTLGCRIKVVWFNQLSFIRIFAAKKAYEPEIMREYAEKLVQEVWDFLAKNNI